MAKYVRTLPPEELSKDEYVVQSPNLFEELQQLSGKIPKRGALTTNFVRNLVMLASMKYAGPGFNPMHVNINGLRNVPFSNLNDLNDKVVKYLFKECPALINGYVDYHIKKRPYGTKLIYFLGDHLLTDSFTRNGIDEIKEKDIASYLGKKPKKIIGKPAVTDSE